jgi:putative transposase
MADPQRQQARKTRGSILSGLASKSRRCTRHRKLAPRVPPQDDAHGEVVRRHRDGELRVNNMSRSAAGTQDNPGRMVKQKAGLNREILSAGLSMAHNMLAYKAVEAGTRLHVSNTRQLKPSQRCATCWGIVPKTLAQRMHVCTHCGHTAQRDQNAASVVLIDAHTPGTGVAARPKPLARQRAKSKSETRETPATASQDA